MGLRELTIGADRRVRAEGMLEDLEAFLRAAERQIVGGHVAWDEQMLQAAVDAVAVPGAVPPYTTMIRVLASATLNASMRRSGMISTTAPALADLFGMAYATVEMLKRDC
jgi:hypothetical protein